MLYAVCPGESDRDKALRAREILRRRDCVLSVQVLQEFYVQATRPSRSDPLTHREAIDLILLWLRFRTVDLTVPVMKSALDLKDRYQISYWDAAIIAAAQAVGCTDLYTEGLNPGQAYGGVRVTNPFQ